MLYKNLTDLLETAVEAKLIEPNPRFYVYNYTDLKLMRLADQRKIKYTSINDDVLKKIFGVKLKGWSEYKAEAARQARSTQEDYLIEEFEKFLSNLKIMALLSEDKEARASLLKLLGDPDDWRDIATKYAKAIMN